MWPIKGQSQRKISLPTFEEINSPIAIGELTNKQLPFDSGQREGINNDTIVIHQLKLTNLTKSDNSQWSLAKYENYERFCERLHIKNIKVNMIRKIQNSQTWGYFIIFHLIFLLKYLVIQFVCCTFAVKL